MTDDDFKFPHIYSILHCTNFDRGIILKSLNQRFSNSRNAVCLRDWVVHKNTEQVLNTEDSIHSPKKDHGSRHDRPMNIYKFFDDRHQFAIRGERHFFSTTVSSEKGKIIKHLNSEISN